MGSSITQHEGTVHSYQQDTRGGTRIVTEGFDEARVPIEIKIEDIQSLVGEKLIQKVDELAENMAGQISRIAFRKLDEVSRDAGTSINAGGPPTKELWLKMFTEMDIDFHPESKRPALVFIAHPVMVETMQNLWEEWKEDKDFMKLYEEILSDKFEAWRDRESRRKLVD